MTPCRLLRVCEQQHKSSTVTSTAPRSWWFGIQSMVRLYHQMQTRLRLKIVPLEFSIPTYSTSHLLCAPQPPS